MKALFAALFLFVLGDFAINHGDGTRHALHAVSTFVTSVGQAGSESVFNQ